MKLFYERYIKLKHVGSGANAHVYKVRHAELGYVRAIKILNDYIEDKDEKVYQSFLKECRTLLTIGNGCHPNIVRIYCPDLIENHAVVEMDYIQGVTLDSYIRKKGFLDYEEAVTFIRDIVGALAYTHHDIYRFLMSPEEDNLKVDPADGSKYLISERKEAELVKKYGISHNDLHSNNVMRRDYDGRFVLLDFGLAVQDGKCVKSSRMGDGNPEYQAPEKFDSDTVSPRSDVYSLGIMMYEALAGKVPFEIEYDASGKASQKAVSMVLDRHLHATPSPILPLRKAAFERRVPGAVYERDYPEWLDGVIMKCLEKNPGDRYADARELLDDIERHLRKDGEMSQTSLREVDSLKSDVARLEKNLKEERDRNQKLIGELADASAAKSNPIAAIPLCDPVPMKEKKHSIWKLWTFLLGFVVVGCAVFVMILFRDLNRMNDVVNRYEGMDSTAFADESVGRDMNRYLPDTVYVAAPVVNERYTDSLLAENSRLRDIIGADTIKIAELQIELQELNDMVNKLRNSKPQSKIEYRTPPDVERELKRLRDRNNTLEAQLRRWRESLPN